MMTAGAHRGSRSPPGRGHGAAGAWGYGGTARCGPHPPPGGERPAHV